MSIKPSRLGRGLDALIPTTLDTQTDQEVAAALQLDETQIVKIPVNDIDPNPHQPRKEFGDAELQELASSIKQHGVLQPIIVVQIAGRYQLIAGERRWRASKQAGKKTIPALIRSFDEQDSLAVAVVENIQRAELSILELAVAYQKLMDQFNLTPDQIAPRVGKATSTIRNTLRLLNLPYEAKKALLENKITEGHARVILSVDDPEQQKAFLKMVIDKDLTVREAEALARNYRADKVLVSKRVQKVENSYQSAVSGLSKSLGTKVEITKNAQGGRVVLRFFSEEELGRMYEQITGESLL